MSTPSEQTYMFDRSWEQERQRLELLEVLRDPATVRRLERTGVDAAWRCLEVGAGRGSVARWLARRTGPDGSVLAIDLEPALLDDAVEPNLDVRGADVLDLDLPPCSFDLIHARALLTHVPKRPRAIERMASWLAPGGWLVLEEPDWLASKAADRSWTALLRAYEQATPAMDWHSGRELVPERTAAGLDDVAADAELDVIHGGTPLAGWWALTLRALRASALAGGTVAEAEIDHQLARLQDPAFRVPGLTWIGATGRVGH
jgi:trans-aconitate methyltransferase